MVNILAAITSCTRCHLYKSMPDGCYPVKGDGPLSADLMIVGEALGKTEALLELPFQGMAGKMLNKMLEAANINRAKTYITNVVKCRPTKNNGKSNRPPSNEEIDRCKSWLYNELCVVRPKVIVTLGKVPTSALLYKTQHMENKTYKLKDLLQQQFLINYHDEVEEIKWTSIVVPCYHPSYILGHNRKMLGMSIEILKMVYNILNNSTLLGEDNGEKIRQNIN